MPSLYQDNNIVSNTHVMNKLWDNHKVDTRIIVDAERSIRCLCLDCVAGSKNAS